MPEATRFGDLAGPRLRRSLTLPQMVLYGLGVTIGAGIYVLIGAMAETAGMHAPVAFITAAVLMSFTAASFAELGSRIPVSASEAAYIDAAFNSRLLSLAAGLLVIAASIVSAAAVSTGSVGYIRTFIDLPPRVIVTAVLVAMGMIAAWGIVELVVLAGLMTLVEIGGLVFIISAGFWAHPAAALQLPVTLIGIGDPTAWLGISAASLLAVFAFIGFEGIVNMNEEVTSPATTLPLAIFLTLAVSAMIYFLVAFVALTAVGPAELAQAGAPLAVVFQRLTGLPPRLMSAIAIIAVLNGVIIQIIMASRVLYGMAARGRLPAILARINPITQTPIVATAVAVAAAAAMALTLQLEPLASVTSRVVLVLFALINLALLRIKAREPTAPAGIFICWSWVPAAGCLSCMLLLLLDALQWATS